jgi:hypothetical protein
MLIRVSVLECGGAAPLSLLVAENLPLAFVTPWKLTDARF